MGCSDFEGDTATVDGDRKGEELAASLFGDGEPH